MKQTVRKAYQFRLTLKPEQISQLVAYTGSLRFVWNKALAMNLHRLEAKQPVLWYQELNFFANLWKQSADYGFLKELPSQSLQQRLKDLDRAFKDAFDKTQSGKRIPVFKKKGRNVDSIRFPQGFKIDPGSNRLFLPKLGWIHYRNSRKIDGLAKNITVSRVGRHWYASIQAEKTIEITPHPATSIIGVDLGVKRLITLSNGRFYPGQATGKRLAGKLAKLQRQLKHKTKFSNNWRKLQAKIARLHERMAHARKDTLHKVSTELSKNHAVIVVEDLKVKNMSKSAKGTREKPGRQVKAKSGLNKAILEQGWGTLVNFLDYKQAWRGGQVIKVDPRHTSRQCPRCSHTARENRRTQTDFQCASCGYRNNADVVGAKNVLTRGHRVLAGLAPAIPVGS
ncbi:transposase (plasmid) [Methylomarinum sp. Ch1-1]|uniref:Transposase n=1 Tax=Methylomarinum roseum TaxID=3067653 RepID=A0AAU7P0S8_9GAMM|nr:transposase [Methylomarinum sp. Ch1-1]MDP4523216.1 transposase [Methylomarinum sp. Ch1-1]